MAATGAEKERENAWKRALWRRKSTKLNQISPKFHKRFVDDKGVISENTSKTRKKQFFI
jgi:hypothetical protein